MKVKPNDTCPCWSGKKYKKCCRDIIDWTSIIRSKQDHVQYMSIRGRNKLFLYKIMDILGEEIDSESFSLEKYKKAFTENNVRKIYEEIIELWSPNATDIENLLKRSGDDVSGLFIGDYSPYYIERAVIRHSLYANKILLVDPFLHPYTMSPEFNPIDNPGPYRSQTLQNVNFYLKMVPWVEAGLVEFIRTPADFDRKMNWEALERTNKIKDLPEIKAALQDTLSELKDRHSRNETFRRFILSSPDSYLRKLFDEISSSKDQTSWEDFIGYINSERESDPNFLEPIGEKNPSQLNMYFAGGTYEMAKLSAQISGSYIFTDLKARWAIIEHDKQQHSTENKVWSPFSKTIQNLKLNYLNNMDLNRALELRQEKRLEGVRSLLIDVWKSVRSEDEYNEETAIHFSNDLTDRVEEAESEWSEIKAHLTKYIGGGVAAAAAAAGPAIATGSAVWFAAASIVGSGTASLYSKYKKKSFIKNYPASFFMDLRDDE